MSISVKRGEIFEHSIQGQKLLKCNIATFFQILKGLETSLVILRDMLRVFSAIIEI
jgi:hypothetical protein